MFLVWPNVKLTGARRRGALAARRMMNSERFAARALRLSEGLGVIALDVWPATPIDQQHS